MFDAITMVYVNDYLMYSHYYFVKQSKDEEEGCFEEYI